MEEFESLFYLVCGLDILIAVPVLGCVVWIVHRMSESSPEVQADYYEDAMPDDVIPWWRDGGQVRGILSDIGKWLLIAAAAYWAHTAQMDAADAKHEAGANSSRLSTLEKGRPLVFGKE